jgi:fimbrial chaperone protein
LRLSIPIFAEPATQAAPHLTLSARTEGGQSYLIAINDGSSHEVVRDIAVTSSDGRSLQVENASPYVLAGATRRWRIGTSALSSGDALHLTAHTDSAAIDQRIVVGNAGP